MEVSRKELADFFEVKPHTIHNWIKRGKLPHTYGGFFKSSLVSWAKSQLKKLRDDQQKLEDLIKWLE